ncbi:MAG: hypothetical protein EA350_12790 [Gemmatimonadales bacterium]|nr:MAG: hypothetical protein EA350_12790 [Gemmatimonadales bacterium]
MKRRTGRSASWTLTAVVGTLLLGPALTPPEESHRSGEARSSHVSLFLKGTLVLHAQTRCFDDRRVRLAPTLFQDGEGDRALGLRASAGVCRLEHDTRADFSRSTYLEGGVDVALPVSELRIPQNLTAGLGIGLSMSLARRAPLDLEADPDDPDARFYDFNYGFLGLGARLGYETDPVWDEQGLTAGAELRWTDPVRAYLPSTAVTLEAVRPVRSGIRDGLGVDREPYARLALSGYWKLRATGPLELGLDAGHFRSWGLDPALDGAGLDSGSFLAGEVGWRVARPLGRLSLDALFLGYAWGQRPTGVAETKAWTLGVEVGIP